MSTIIVAIILVGSVAAICFLLISIHNKQKRSAMNRLLKHFSQLGTGNDLNFSSQEVLNNCILGVDGIHRKVLVVTREDGFFSSFIVDLNRIKTCSVKKIYGTIRAGDLKSHKLEQYLEKITLHFEMADGTSVQIPFYKHFENPIHESSALEQKARHWETILSKMQMPLKNIA